MKIRIPELEIPDGAGFSGKLDLFKRAGFGEKLANVIHNTDDKLVLGLDAGWGEGKTTFVKMWTGHVENHRGEKLRAIYFDAFENDYQKDPFLALAAAIYEKIPPTDKAKQRNFWRMTSTAAAVLGRGFLRVGVKTATAGLVDGTSVEAIKEDLSTAMAEQVDALVKRGSNILRQTERL